MRFKLQDLLRRLFYHSPLWLVLLALFLALGSIVYNAYDFYAERRVIEPEMEVSKSNTPTLLKLAFVSDWEYGTRKRLKHKLPYLASQELEKIVNYLNTEFRPEIVIGGGDYIESSAIKPATAREQLKLVNNIFKKLEAPRIYAIGNHDVRSLSIDEVKEVLEIAETHTYRDIGDWRLVVMDTNYDPETDSHRSAKSYVTGYVNSNELIWLKQVLATTRPILLFSHHSPLPVPNQNGRGYIKNIENAPTVRQLLEESGNVVAVVSGHNPLSYYEERNGIHYFVVDTLVNEAAIGSFATIEAKYLASKRFAELSYFHHGVKETRLTVDRTLGETEFDLIPKYTTEMKAIEEPTDEEGTAAPLGQE